MLMMNMYGEIYVYKSGPDHVTWAPKLGSPVATVADSPLQKNQACPHATTLHPPPRPAPYIPPPPSHRKIHLLSKLRFSQIVIPPSWVLLSALWDCIPS